MTAPGRGLPLGIGAQNQPFSHPAKLSTVGLRAPRRIHTFGHEETVGYMSEKVQLPAVSRPSTELRGCALLRSPA